MDNRMTITTQGKKFSTTSSVFDVKFRYPYKNSKTAVSDLTKMLTKMGVMDGLKEKSNQILQ